MSNHCILLQRNGKEVKTFEDILPDKKDFLILFVGKAPAPDSIEEGHYFSTYSAFWNKLANYGLFNPSGDYNDDYLIEHDYGITDLVKVPHQTGDEPTDDEYRDGSSRFFKLLNKVEPKILVFIYKGALDKLLKISLCRDIKTYYGFNKHLEREFGSKVFVFPMPGTPCDSITADKCMQELRDEVASIIGIEEYILLGPN